MIVTQKAFDWQPSPEEIQERIKSCREAGIETDWKTWEPWNFFELGGKHSSLCFLCGEKLTVPCIMWVGPDDAGNGELWFHIECAKIFGQKLL